MGARQQLNNLTIASVRDIMGLSDEEILAECREDGIDPEAQAADMRRQFDHAALFAPVEDVNGKPRPRWEEMLEEKVSAGLVGEALSLVRYLIEVNSSNQLREPLAALAHEQWCGWMRYMFGRSSERIDGTVIIPRGLVERWTRQMETAYVDLPEDEKKSDRTEADKVLAVLRGGA